MIILGPKTAILGPQFCRILVLGPHFWWSGDSGPPLDPPLIRHLTLNTLDFRRRKRGSFLLKEQACVRQSLAGFVHGYCLFQLNPTLTSMSLEF